MAVKIFDHYMYASLFSTSSHLLVEKMFLSNCKSHLRMKIQMLSVNFI